MGWVPKQRVIVPIDFSESSVPAVQEALTMVESPGHVHVVHVLAPLEMLSPGVVLGTTDDATRVEHARKYMATYLASHEVEGVSQAVLIGDPGSEIVGFAGSEADLIVIPSHGFHGMRRMLLGSVAERVIRHADCPVYVLRRIDAE